MNIQPNVRSSSHTVCPSDCLYLNTLLKNLTILLVHQFTVQYQVTKNMFRHLKIAALRLPPAQGVHDLGMDGSLPPSFRKATFLLLPKSAFMHTFMMNLGGKLASAAMFHRFSQADPSFEKICLKMNPCFREFGAKKPTHICGTYL